MKITSRKILMSDRAMNVVIRKVKFKFKVEVKGHQTFTWSYMTKGADFD